MTKRMIKMALTNVVRATIGEGPRFDDYPPELKRMLKTVLRKACRKCRRSRR